MKLTEYLNENSCVRCICNLDIEHRKILSEAMVRNMMGTTVTSCFHKFVEVLAENYPTTYRKILNKIIEYYNENKLTRYSFPCNGNGSSTFKNGETLKFFSKLLNEETKLEIE